jgi:polysaccharide export outer membrane protein
VVRAAASPAAWLAAASLGLLGSPVLADDPPAAAQRPDEPYEGDYVIGVEDLLQIAVWKTPDLSLNVPVRPDGKISLPLIDDVQAAGLTPAQLKDVLTERWKLFVSDPEVSVIVQEINSYKVFLVGEVTRPGELRLKAKTSLAQAISLAGGFTAFAHPEKIVVLRRSAHVETRYEVNFKKVVSGDRPELNMLLHPGDTVFVP